MRLLFAFLLTFGALQQATATTFTVTNNGDSGPGTLREALQQAAASGGTNSITFNITDQSQAGRTITLASALPALTSNLTIDGTTQPGTPFGASNARVIITNPGSLADINYFEMISVSNIQIYGLYLQSVVGGYCFHFRAATNLTFGAPGKGNLIQGFAQVFDCDYLTANDPSSIGVTVQGNIMGTDINGTIANGSTLNGIDFYLRNVGNLQIGGLNPGEGNLMVEQDYPMDFSSTYNRNFGYVNIEGNIQGADITGLHPLSPNHYNFSIDGWNDGNENVAGTTPLSVTIINNISVGGFGFFDIAGQIIIQGNHLGVAADNVTNLTSTATSGNTAMLSFTYCATALVGGTDPTQKNYIANDNYGVLEFYSSTIKITQNSFFCNQIGISLNWVLPRPEPFISINQLTAGGVGGTALPNSTIELFYDDECPGCEGKTYIGTTTADNNGNWSYSLTATGAIVATATDTYGSTSPFSTATINTTKLVVANATCGRNNGSIKNIQVTSGTEWYWQDANGNIVANSTDLTGVGPGTYTFVTSIGGASCNASTTPYTITNVNLPAFDPSAIAVTQTGCGLANGSFQYFGSFDPATTYSWLSAGATVCPDFSAANPLASLAPGTYTLQLALKQDPTCVAQYGPFTLVNQNGPTVDRTNVQVTPASCGKNDGSITGIGYQNAVPPVYYAWEGGTLNDNLQVIARTLDLVGVNAGAYRFVFKDGSSCDTIFTNLIIVADNGAITYDTSSMVITPASCDMSNGSIVGIMSTNATTYTWINTANNAPAGDLEDLIDLGGGVYQLSMSNTYGCQAQTPAIRVSQLGFPIAPQVEAQYIPRNTSATIVVIDPQKGVYELLDGPGTGATILDTSSIGVFHTPNVPQDETLYVGYSNGDCSSPLAPVNIKVFDSLRIYIPNAFSPNGDGVNDRWHIFVQAPTKKLQVSIYDRWGSMVFQSNDPNLSWDGTAAGHPLSGTFVYIVGGVDYFNHPFLLKGTLMIIR